MGDLFLDHIEIVPEGSIRRSTDQSQAEIAHGVGYLYPPYNIESLNVRILQIVLPLKLYFKTWQNIEEGVDAPLSPQIQLILDIFSVMVRDATDRDGNVLPWHPKAYVTFNSIDFGNLDSAVTLNDEDRDKIYHRLKNIGSISFPLGLGPINQSAGKSLDYWNVGVSADIGAESAFPATSVAIRWEINGPTESYDSWTEFYEGNIAELPEGKDWSLLIPSNLLTDLFIQRLHDRLELEDNKSDDDKRIQVTEWPSVTWIPLGGGRIITDFSLDIVDHDETHCVNDIGVDIKITSDLSVADKNSLQMTGQIDHDAIDSDAALCAFLKYKQYRLDRYLLVYHC